MRPIGFPRAYYYLEIVILVCGLFIDWLFYFVFALWLALRLAGDGRDTAERSEERSLQLGYCRRGFRFFWSGVS